MTGSRGMTNLLWMSAVKADDLIDFLSLPFSSSTSSPRHLFGL